MKTEPNHLIHSFNDAEGYQGNFSGLTKREYFAAMAMQGLLASDYVKNGLYASHETFPAVHKIAVRVADDLIEALND